MGLLQQLFGPQGAQNAQGILGQEIGAQMGGQGFMGQADLQPQVGAAQQQQPQLGGMEGAQALMQNPAFQQQLGAAMGGQQQQQPVPQMQIPQQRQTVQSPQIPQGGAEQWMQGRRLPSFGYLGGFGQ